MASRADYLSALPRKRVTAAALIRDLDGRVLLVEPTYKDHWQMPGGTVESDEPPARGASREVLEELGVSLLIGRPLVMHWLRPHDDPEGVLHFSYDGGVVDSATIRQFRLPAEELRSFQFIERVAATDLMSRETAVRLDAALEALQRGGFTELGP